jgi:bacteriorhodopsin
VNKKLDSAGNTHEFAKVNSIVAVYSKYTRPLTLRICNRRMVFFGHFVDRIFSMPLILYSLCMVANAEMGEIVLLLGLDLLMVGCTAIGATQLHPWKWIWSLSLYLCLSRPCAKAPVQRSCTLPQCFMFGV